MKLFSTKIFAHLNFKLAITSLIFTGALNAQTDTYSSPGTVDWVVPACVTSVTVRAWGAGGAGGGARSTDCNGGGGGGGAFSIAINEPVTPGETLRITVGAGGVGVSQATGGAGGFSQVQHLTGAVVFCRAAGGAGGQMGGNSSTAGAGGAGGAIANNIPVGAGFRGGNGGSSDANTGSSDRSGGGGGGAGTAANGGNGGIVTAGAGGATGGGAGGAGRNTTNSAGENGFAGNPLGGGGGGSTCYTGSARAGAAGARGEVTITYVVDCGVPDPVLPPGASANAYITPGTYNWTVPSCVTVVKVEAWAGGGGGGGTIGIIRTSGDDGFNTSEVCVGAGGGGGGGFTSRTIAVTPGQVYSVVVGAGGTAGPAGSGTWNGGISTPAGTGGTGGTSSFSGNGVNLQATGGTGGGGASGYHNLAAGVCLLVNGTSGTGGTGSAGSVNFTGGNGAPGLILSHSTDKSGGGGGAAGPGGDGGNAALGGSVGVTAPPGGAGSAPGGNGGNGRMTNVPGIFAGAGNAGVDIGGGGGGSLVHRDPFNVSAASGGAGARGEVRLSYISCLPIELMHFGGENKREFNELTWITATEKINDFFTLERSVNGTDWEKVATVKGSGTTQEIQNYSFDDRGYTKGIVNYYRLSQTDTDGTQTYVGSVIPINNRFSHLKVVSRYNAMGQEVGADAKGVVITLYEDGTTERVYID